MVLSAGARLGPYEILASLGAGGMGVVYHATDTKLGRPVALKIIRAELLANEEVRRRFEREDIAIDNPGVRVGVHVGVHQYRCQRHASDGAPNALQAQRLHRNYDTQISGKHHHFLSVVPNLSFTRCFAVRIGTL